MKNRVVILLLVFTSLKCVSPKTETIELLGEFESHMTLNEIKDKLTIEVDIDNEYMSVAKVDFVHLEVEGKLLFLLFENQLTGVGFYPQDSIKYFDSFYDTYKVDIKNHTKHEEGNLIIEKLYDYEMGSIGGMYIAWIDKRLKNKYDNKIW